MRTDLTQQPFSALIASGLVLVDFGSPWCGLRRMQNPILNEMDEKNPTVKISKINMD